VRDADGNPDTSFLAKIPADTPFTFQTLDRNGTVLNMSQTWHQVRPGEVRTDCGGCHAHAQVPTAFAGTAASRPGYHIADLTQSTPLLTRTGAGEPTVAVRPYGALDVEYYRDIKPLLQRSCVQCHAAAGRHEAGLVLDDTTLVDGYENTYNRLARDERARFGIPPIIPSHEWRNNNASRYVRKFQSRRSLLAWKVFGRRLDGWTNADFPTESVPGDAATLPKGANAGDADLDYSGVMCPPPGSGVPPLSAEEQLRIARWIDLGAPVTSPLPAFAGRGWFQDDLRPTLTLSEPARGVHSAPLSLIRIGAFDYYSGLDLSAWSVRASFPVNGRLAGAELADLLRASGQGIWTIALDPPVTNLADGTVTVTVRDRQRNLSKVERSFSVRAAR
jgi:hypothetical protein